MSDQQTLCPCKSGVPFADCHGDEGGRYWGWKEIAAALDVSEDTAVSYSRRPYDPLPVRADFAERVYISKRALASWVNRHDLPAWAWAELDRVKRLPKHMLEKERKHPGVRQAARAKVAKRVRA